MNYYHKELAAGRWAEMTFLQQMANIGGEVQRAINWRDKNREYSQLASDRALELIDLTVSDKKNKCGGRLKEILRLREVWVDYFYFDNIYQSTAENWQKYFLSFNFAANK